MTPVDTRGASSWMTRLDPVRIADAYRLPHVIDYGSMRGRGLLITTGAGLLMSDMDVLPTCRWAIDIGASRGHPHAADWALVCARSVTHTVAHLWMAITDPDWMTSVLEAFPPERLAVCAWPTLALGHQVADIAELARWCAEYRSRWSMEFPT